MSRAKTAIRELKHEIKNRRHGICNKYIDENTSDYFFSVGGVNPSYGFSDFFDGGRIGSAR